MKDNKYSKKVAYIGAGCGVVLFAIFGLLPGSFIGGAMGLNLSGILLGSPVTSVVLSRLIIAASIGVGVIVSGIIIISAATTAGWLIGTVVDELKAEKKELVTSENKKPLI